MFKNRPVLSVSASKISEASFKIAANSKQRNAFVQNPMEVLGQFGIELNRPEIKYEDGVVCTSEICTPPAAYCAILGAAAVALVLVLVHTAAIVLMEAVFLATDVEIDGMNGASINNTMSNQSFYNIV